MANKYRIAKLEDVAENLRSLYKADPKGGFVLDMDIDVTDLEARAQAAASATQQAQQAADAQAATTQQLKDLQARLDQQAAEVRTYQTRLYESQIGEQATQAFIKAGGLDKALPMVQNQIRGVFKQQKDGTIAALGADGKPLLNKAGKAHDINSYISEVVSVEHDYLFKPSTGGGAGGNGGGGPTVKNPFDPKAPNLTEQSKLYRDNPAVARQLAAEHGITI